MTRSAVESCPCRCEWTKAVGTFDTVTEEWLPEEPTAHVRLVLDPRCPFHAKDDS